MKSCLLVTLIAALLALPALTAAHDPSEHNSARPVARADPATVEVLTVVDEFSAALKAGQLDRASALLAEDVLILESGGAEHSRDEYIGGHAVLDAAFLKSAGVRVKQRAARVEGPLAWVGTESEIQTSKDGKPLSVQSTETMVLKKNGTGWQIVHIHWSSH